MYYFRPKSVENYTNLVNFLSDTSLKSLKMQLNLVNMLIISLF